MSQLIRLLPDTIANQIAAGEVVQRPASVVKELIENAIDAQSSAIKVVIKEAGKTLIQVIDDGRGMSEVDARMSLEKHATSKISTTADLFNIQTMGFRGEALASIGAVAQLEMETCLQAEELGTQLIVEGSSVKLQEPVSAAKGTKISVKNLFFNVPARRSFLKSNSVESKHILDEFQRAALARPDIAFSLYQNDTETYQLPATKLSHRIVHLLGGSHKQQLIPCQEETALLKIKGYIGKPTHAKKTRGDQFFFVNQRFIKSPYLHHAVKSAFEGLLPSDAFPFYVLFIEIDPARIDVNVHPTKTEIKFEDERMVYSVLIAAIKQALAVHHMTPSLDFEQNTNYNPFQSAPSTRESPRTGIDEKNYAQFKGTHTAQARPQDWANFFQGLAQDKPTAHAQSAATSPPDSTTQQAASSQPSKASTEHEGTFKMQLQARYLLAQVKSGLLLIDQQAAHTRILYEKYMRDATHQGGGATQQLLFPLHVTLNAADIALLKDCEAEIRALGFAFESFGKDSLIVTGCPVEAVDHELQEVLEGLLEQFKWNQAQLSLPKQESLARALAQRASIPPGKKLHKEEIDMLVDQLFACTQPDYTPDGRKTFVILTLQDIEHIFSHRAK